MTGREYRGWSIVKTDTGSRRLGREVWYWATSPTGERLAHPLLRGVRALIDARESV